MGAKHKDLRNCRFGNLLVISREKIPCGANNKLFWRWQCICDCGKQCWKSVYSLEKAKLHSCGCLKLIHNQTINLKLNQTYGKLLNFYKTNAKSRKIEWLLSDEQFANLIKQNCHFCNSEPSATTYTYCRIKRSTQEKMVVCKTYIANGIDRIDSSLSYEINNCVACCKQCNFAKNNKTLKEFKMWLIKVVNHLTPIL